MPKGERERSRRCLLCQSASGTGWASATHSTCSKVTARAGQKVPRIGRPTQHVRRGHADLNAAVQSLQEVVQQGCVRVQEVAVLGADATQKVEVVEADLGQLQHLRPATGHTCAGATRQQRPRASAALVRTLHELATTTPALGVVRAPTHRTCIVCVATSRGSNKRMHVRDESGDGIEPCSSSAPTRRS